jgi:hypothetical protein
MEKLLDSWIANLSLVNQEKKKDGGSDFPFVPISVGQAGFFDLVEPADRISSQSMVSHYIYLIFLGEFDSNRPIYTNITRIFDCERRKCLC